MIKRAKLTIDRGTETMGKGLSSLFGNFTTWWHRNIEGSELTTLMKRKCVTDRYKKSPM